MGYFEDEGFHFVPQTFESGTPTGLAEGTVPYPMRSQSAADSTILHLPAGPDHCWSA